ncbi:MAG: threonine synthase, partial [Acetobacteraceae bacterium]
AIGTAAARALPPDDPAVPIITAATAHPAKFPDAVARATSVHPALPPHLADLFEREERFTVLPADLGAVHSAVRAHIRRNIPVGAA